MARLTDTELEDLKIKVNDLCELEGGLSEWEVNFVESMSHKDFSRYGPSDKEQSKIKELHERHCAR